MGLELITSLEADTDEIAKFQRQSFDQESGPRERAAIQTSEYYSWKYSSFGTARIAQLRRDNELVSMCAAVPVKLISMNTQITGWQICDIATKASERGRGFFSQCLQVLSDSIENDDIFFGFPNKNSAPLLAKRGWLTIDTLKTFAGLIPNTRPIGNIAQIGKFQDRHIEHIVETLPNIRIRKSSTYLNARYCSSSGPIYTCFALEDQGSCQGWIVVRTLCLFGIQTCLIMDCCSATASAKRKLFLHVGAWSLRQRCIVTLSINNIWPRLNLLKYGLVPIPQKIVPRPLILMATKKSYETIGARSWNLQLGDWDGF